MREQKKGLNAPFGGSRKEGNPVNPATSRSSFHHASPPLTGPYVLQCCFIRAGQARDPCEEPVLIMHEAQLPGENTTRAGKRGKEARQEAQKARFTLIPGLA